MQQQAFTTEIRAARDPREALLDHVRAVVHERLTAGRPSKASIAAALDISQRTLHRRLAEHGTTYDRVVREARARRTFELLADPAVTMYDVATAAGYRGLASFYRAFRAWTGTTPAAYRAAQTVLSEHLTG
jgi:AraC-like DNA-binding protein